MKGWNPNIVGNTSAANGNYTRPLTLHLEKKTQYFSQDLSGYNGTVTPLAAVKKKLSIEHLYISDVKCH
jgi:hypothetical protein